MLFELPVADLVERHVSDAPAAGRPARRRRHRHLGRAPRSGYRRGAPDAQPGPDRRVGLRRGRHGPGLVRPGRRRHRGRRRRWPAACRSPPSSRARACGWKGGELIRAAGGGEQRRPAADPGPARRRRPGAVPAWRARIDGWDVRSPVVKLNCGLRRLPRFTAAGPRRHLGVPGHGRAVDGHRRHPGRVRGRPAGRAGARLVRAVLPDRLRPERRPARPAHHERLRPVRPLPAGRRATGTAVGTRSPRPVLDRIAQWAPDVARLRRALAAARAARRRGPHRADRRPHLPGIVPARPDVGPPAAGPDAASPGSTCAAPPPIRAAA